jgi:hypothetical protein
MNLPEYTGQDQSITDERARIAAEYAALIQRLEELRDELRAELIQKHPLLSWRVDCLLATRSLLITAEVIANAQKLTVKYCITDDVLERERAYAVEALAYNVARSIADAMLTWRSRWYCTARLAETPS